MIILHLVPDIDATNDTANTLLRAHIESPIRVTADRTRAALELLDACPANIPAPEVRVSLEGELALLWEQDQKMLAVRAEPDGWIKFGVAFGNERREGLERFHYPTLPPVLSEILSAFKRVDA
jgi:hypothetical protein